MRKLLLAFALLAFVPNVYAGKKDDIMSACGGKISEKEAASKIKEVFFNCNSGQKIKIGECEIECKKQVEGAKVGG